MGDPLVDRYGDSFQTQQPGRKGRIRLEDAKLKKLSEQIQTTGQHPGTPTPTTATIRFARLEDPQEWLSGARAPSSMQQQFELLKRQELEGLVALAEQPTRAPKTESPVLPSQPPISMQQQSELLKRQLREWLAKTRDELWRAESVEYDVLFELYDAMVVDEYKTLAKSAKAQFKEFEERGGVYLYRELRPIYFRAKVKEPHKFIMQMLQPTSTVQLAMVTVNQGIHPYFAAILQRVDKKVNTSVKANPGERPVRYVGCFRPDAIGSRISNHMIGAAIDIDSRTNPHLKGPQIKAIDKMLAFMAEEEAKGSLVPPEVLKVAGSWLAEIPKGDDPDAVEIAQKFYEKAVKISEKTKKFLDQFLKEFEKKQSPTDPLLQRALPIVKALSDAFDGVKALRKLQSEGFISVPAELFKALVSDPELQWGNYTYVHPNDKKREPGLDVMHFEVKPAVQRAIIAAFQP